MKITPILVVHKLLETIDLRLVISRLFYKNVKNIGKIIFPVMLVSCGTPGSTQSGPVAPATPFAGGIYYNTYSGQVGYHLAMRPLLAPATSPNGLGCGWGFSYAELVNLVDSDLPPGIEFDNGFFSGTPRQPGQWNARVRFYDVHCTNGNDPDRTTTGDVRVTVNFNISP